MDPPYVARLVGEYVLEIVELIRERLGDLDDDRAPLAVAYGAFAAANPEFLELTRQHAISDWNCYYRRRYPYAAYPAFAVVAAMERVGSRSPRPG
jgi:hypothetical protein